MELLSYHLIEAPFFSVVLRLLGAGALREVRGLRHGEFLLPMKMGHPVSLPSRYRYDRLGFIAWWAGEEHLDAFLQQPPYAVFLRPSWHVRMRAYRRWGTYPPLDEARIYEELAEPEGPVIGLTLARLKLTETFRFARWGKPVEVQVRDHPGVTRATVAFRPLNTFSTFSMWRSEGDMLDMVRGRRADIDGASHRNAMVERGRRPFHYAFTTMRLIPLSEHGHWPEPRGLLQRAQPPGAGEVGP